MRRGRRGGRGVLQASWRSWFWEGWPLLPCGGPQAALFPPLPGACALRPPHPVRFALRRFDIYRKVPKDLTQPTYTGAISE